MLDYNQALQDLLSMVDVQDKTQDVELYDAINLILAEAVTAQYDSPLFSNSAMDGYALGSDSEQSTHWEIVDRVIAGDNVEHIHLREGQAARIFTGAPIPIGTVTVVQQELCQVENSILTVTKPIKKDQNIRQKGEEFQKNALLLQKGQKLNPAIISIIASQGYSQIKTFKPLNIVVFSTGNELIDQKTPLTPGKIYDANRFMLLNWLKQSRHHIIDGGILPDNAERTEQALLKASQSADIIITSGGVSVGEEDHVLNTVKKIGEMVFWKLAIKPGKPFAWGKIKKSKIFMLPGNPVSSLVTFQQLVVPALCVIAGESVEKSMPNYLMAKADFVFNKAHGRREFLRVHLYPKDDGLHVKKASHQGSAMLAALIDSNALAEIPPNTIVSENDLVKVYPLTYQAI